MVLLPVWLVILGGILALVGIAAIVFYFVFEKIDRPGQSRDPRQHFPPQAHRDKGQRE